MRLFSLVLSVLCVSMLMKLVRGITSQEVNDWQWKTLQDRISPVINGVSTMNVCFEFRSLYQDSIMKIMLWAVRSKQLAKRQHNPHQEKKGEKHVTLPKRSLGGMVLHSECIHLDLNREYYNRTRQRSTLPCSTTETSQGVLLGCWVFQSWVAPYRGMERPATGWGFNWATITINPLNHTTDDPSKATSVTSAPVTAQRTSLLQSYTPA